MRIPNRSPKLPQLTDTAIASEGKGIAAGNGGCYGPQARSIELPKAKPGGLVKHATKVGTAVFTPMGKGKTLPVQRPGYHIEDGNTGATGKRKVDNVGEWVKDLDIVGMLRRGREAKKNPADGFESAPPRTHR